MGGNTNLTIFGLPLPVAVVTTWGIMVVVALLSFLLTRRLGDNPERKQVLAEGIVLSMYEAVASVSPAQADRIFPFIATLWIFVLAANISGVIPGIHSPTANISVTAALAIIVFLSVHWFGVRSAGLKVYLSHYLKPNPVLLPFHIISELTRTIALAVRLFGNMMSLNMAAAMILLVAGFLVPVPLLMLHLVEAVVQAYIFGMLALIYIASAVQSQEPLKV